MRCACGTEFTPRRNAKTCSKECGRRRTAKRQRDYHVAHPEAKRSAQLRYREVIASVNVHRKINRAVRLLFALTGEAYHE